MNEQQIKSLAESKPNDLYNLQVKVDQQQKQIESLQRQNLMFIRFVDQVNQFMAATHIAMEQKVDKPKLEVVKNVRTS